MTTQYNAFKAVLEVQTLYHGILKDLDNIAKQSFKKNEYSSLVNKISDYLEESKSGLATVTEEFKQIPNSSSQDVGERLSHAVESYILSSKASDSIKSD